MRIIPLLTVLTLALLASAAPVRAARDAERPLLVVVEVGPGLGVGASDVRQAVAAELGKNVIGTREAGADGATDVLLVVLGPGEIRMSLRAGAAPIISRAIAVPPDRNGRLRSIGWLAGNLVRDQVGPIVATREAAAPSVEALAATEPAAPPTSPPPLPAASQPAPVPSTSLPAPAAPPIVVSSAAAPPAAIPHAGWSITAMGGPVATATRDGAGSARVTNVTGSSTFQLELQRQKAPDSMLLGIAFTAGPSAPRHYVGAAAFAGEAWRGQSWFVEATFGLGVEALDGYARIGSSTGTAPTADSPSTVTSVSESRISVGAVPGLFVRVAGTGGFSISRFFDLVAQLGAHLSSEGDIGSYLGATAGVRLRL